LKYLDNPHAKRVVEKTAQLWLHIPISFGMVKAEELRQMISEPQHYAIPATWNLTKANRSPRLNVLKCGKKHTEKLLAGFLQQGGLK
jgi:hypothetical protein